ncbi:MAG: neutral/alkaline non-lysosomal ceramidase N-terminal domain-containing protein [Oscillospiraceae bacterium]|nr:neutral/alkaline non-lysosomal ceramidase N-terminal domain-containing protein [Oscillospiraceae bacterium]
MSLIQVGFGKSCLTPRLGVELTGYGTYRERVGTDVEMDLWARTTAWDVDGVRFVMVVCDLLAFTEKLSADTVNLIASENRISADNVFLAATHTHTGPATGALVGCGEPDIETIAALPGKIAASVKAAFEDLAEVISVSTNEDTMPYTFVLNRQMNDDYRIDPTIRTMRIERKGKKTVAISNYSCHPVCPDLSSVISPDYPGHFCKKMEDAGYEAMYLNGFCGNLNPIRKGQFGCADQAAQRLFDRSHELFETEVKQDIDGVGIVAGREPIELRHVDPMDTDAGVQFWLDRNNWKLARSFAVNYDRIVNRILYMEDPYTEYMEFKALRLGKALFIFHSGEVCSPFGDMLREAFPDYTVFIVGTAFATTRYIGTEKNADEANSMYMYEILDSCGAYGTIPIVRGAGEKHFAGVIRRIKPIV